MKCQLHKEEYCVVLEQTHPFMYVQKLIVQQGNRSSLRFK